jgi:hypothetical protein
VKADVGIDQRFLRGGDAIDYQSGLYRCAALDQPQGNRAELEVPSRAAREANCAPIELQPCSRGWQRVDAAVQVQAYESARRSSEIVDPRDRLLTAVAAFVQVHGSPEQTDLVRNGSVVGVEADPGDTGSDPTGVQRPGASSGPAAHHVCESITRHKELSAVQRVGANPSTMITGQLSRRPHDGMIIASVGYFNPHQEPHPVQPAHQRVGCARFGVRPEGLTVIDAVQDVFDVAVR